MQGLLRCAPRPRPTACGDGGFAASLSRKRGPLELQECSDHANGPINYWVIHKSTVARLCSLIYWLSPLVNLKVLRIEKKLVANLILIEVLICGE